jgi:hypothetical protein
MWKVGIGAVAVILNRERRMERGWITAQHRGIATAFILRSCRVAAAVIPTVFTLLLAACASDGGSSTDSMDAAGSLPVARSTTVNIGGAEIKFEPVHGWCLASREQSRKVLEDAPRSIRAYAVMADCRQLQAADGSDELPASFGFIATPTQLISTDVGEDRAAFVDTVVENVSSLDLAEAAREALASKRDEIQNEIDAARRQGVEIHMNDPIDLGLLAHDDSAACFGMQQKFAVKAVAYSDDIGFVTLLCATEIRSRAVILTLQTMTPSASTYGGPEVANALRLARLQIEQLIELNPDLGLAI